MADDDRRPDHTKDPRKQDQASEGYPESAPAGADKEADQDDAAPQPQDAAE